MTPWHHGIGWFALSIALCAILIPFPSLLPLSLVGWAVIWLVTPAYGGRR